jgi:hypothetical protein
MREAIDYSRLMADDDLTEEITMRISKADRELLDALASRMPLKVRTLARVALRVGLAEIEKDPARIFASGKPTKGAKR